MKSTASALLALGASPLLTSSTLPLPPQGCTPPNVLLIIADDLGVDMLGAYDPTDSCDLPGSELPCTPNIDSLASNGVLFRTAWSAPRCTPTRATIFTGRYGFRTGVGNPYNHENAKGAAQTHTPLSARELLLPLVLRPTYTSGLFGKWHLGHEGNGGIDSVTQYPGPDIWFDEFHGTMLNPLGDDDYYNYPWVDGFASVAAIETDVTGLSTELTTYLPKVTLEALDTFLSSQAGPWFAVLSFNLPHAPPHWPIPSGPEPMNPTSREVYVAMVEEMDRRIGEALSFLDEQELAETVVVFVGDNGTPGNATFGDPNRAKGTLFEGGIHVPLIVKGPVVGGTVPRELDDLVHTTDIFSTIAAIGCVDLETAYPHWDFDGVSFLPLLEGNGGGERLRDFLFTEDFLPNGTAFDGPDGQSPEVWDDVDLGQDLVTYTGTTLSPPGTWGGVWFDTVRGHTSTNYPESFTYGNELEITLKRSDTTDALDVFLLFGPELDTPIPVPGGEGLYLVNPCAQIGASWAAGQSTTTIALTRQDSIDLFDDLGLGGCLVAPELDYFSATPSSFFAQVQVVVNGQFLKLAEAVSLNFHWPRGVAVRDERFKLIRFGRGGAQFFFDFEGLGEDENLLPAGVGSNDPTYNLTTEQEDGYAYLLGKIDDVLR